MRDFEPGNRPEDGDIDLVVIRRWDLVFQGFLEERQVSTGLFLRAPQGSDINVMFGSDALHNWVHGTPPFVVASVQRAMGDILSTLFHQET